MSPFAPPLERLQYVDGQVLASRDLRESERYNARLRAFHNRYLHNTWGIARGLQIGATPNKLAAMVAPGYAIDGVGNWIFVLEAVTVEAPRVAGAQVLVLTLTSPGEIAWWLPRDLTPGPQVILGAAFVTNGVITGTIDTGMRRYVQSLATPRLALGTTAPGQTSWVDSAGPAKWTETAVDTSSAGFVGVPQYFATLQPAGPPIGVVSASPHAFALRVIGATSQQAQAGAWTVSWVGIESEGLL